MSQNSLNWDEMYIALKAFRKQYGHSNVSSTWSKNPQLGRWVAMQRYRRKIGELPAACIARLDHLGFCWSCADAAWHQMFQRLLEFRKRHGSFNVPLRSPADRKLATWVASQRHRKKRGTLPPERAKLLDRAGFVWAIYGRGDERKVEASKPAAPRKAAAEVEERLYMVGPGRYTQYNGQGPIPASLERYLEDHREFPPHIPLPHGRVTFQIGGAELGRERKVIWNGKGPIPEVVRAFVDENGALPPHG